ncbi:uncharacterized protein LOC6581164 [Drosophila mojavensis]|uniref:Uncharacterized protein n=1 Tax=Drosophila mojavensis TaxID=7230 RepID=B4KMJ7_DROMO|nr:uncharacterized protein LOC6581164 [Drosophila mojavensis]EDW10844.1 uncharacterized protein Dmoj_GI18337 [Drosophila mojavensis]
MFAGLLKFLLHLALWQCISGRIPLMPKFFGQDSAIIVDTDKLRLNPKLQNGIYYNIPAFKLINPITHNPSSITYTKTAVPRGAGEYPKDLIDIARTKLGFKRIDQLPSLSELGSLLGTSNDDETIKYVRSLTSTDQGIALMKAYLESTDSNNDSEDKPEANDNYNNADFDVDYDATPSRLDIPVTTPQMETGGLMKGVNELINQYKLWPGLDNSTKSRRLPYKHMLVAPVQPSSNHKQSLTPALRPLLLRSPLPYHYPIPLRPVLFPKPMTTTPRPAPVSNDANTDLRPPHLNTPKGTTSDLVAPHVHELARIANISPDILDSFLQQQPKLAELAKRFSRLPLVQQHSKAIDSQLFMAVKRALAQDNLKRLLGASQT